MEQDIIFSPISLDKLKETIKNTVEQALNQSSQNELMRVEDVCDYLKITKATVYGLIYRNKIPYFKRGKFLFFYKKSIDNWI